MDPHRRPAARPAVDPHRAEMRGDQARDERQAQARPVRLRRVERLQCVLDRFRRHPRPRVRDLEVHTAVRRPSRQQCQSAAAGHRLHRVRHQILERVLETPRVRPDLRQVRPVVPDHLHIFHPRIARQSEQRRVEHVRDPHQRRLLDAHRPRQREQVLHRAGQVIQLLVHRLQHVLPLPIQLVFRLQYFESGADRRERPLELVRHLRRHLAHLRQVLLLRQRTVLRLRPTLRRFLRRDQTGHPRLQRAHLITFLAAVLLRPVRQHPLHSPDRRHHFPLQHRQHDQAQRERRSQQQADAERRAPVQRRDEGTHREIDLEYVARRRRQWQEYPQTPPVIRLAIQTIGRKIRRARDEHRRPARPFLRRVRREENHPRLVVHARRHHRGSTGELTQIPTRLVRLPERERGLQRAPRRFRHRPRLLLHGPDRFAAPVPEGKERSRAEKHDRTARQRDRQLRAERQPPELLDPAAQHDTASTRTWITHVRTRPFVSEWHSNVVERLIPGRECRRPRGRIDRGGGDDGSSVPTYSTIAARATYATTCARTAVPRPRSQ